MATLKSDSDEKSFVFAKLYPEGKNLKAVKTLKKYIFDRQALKELAHGEIKLENLVKDDKEDEATGFVIKDTYHLEPEDLLQAMKNAILDAKSQEIDSDEDEDDSSRKVFMYAEEINNKTSPFFNAYSPHITEATWEKDPFELNPDRLTCLGMHLIIHLFDDLSRQEKVDGYEELVQASKEGKACTSLKGLKLILSDAYQNMPEDTEETEFTPFYRENLKALADSHDYDALYYLGYDSYEGIQSFPVDYFLAEKCFKEAFQIKEDYSIANTLGYIYYYGRLTNGVVEGDKAFQYFAICHFCNGNPEATYKLADCYVHGYGTPVCKKAAFELVSSMERDCSSMLFHGTYYCKAADVYLRLGAYYRDGTGVLKDLSKSYQYFLKARAAIHFRLENMEYLGDREVANRIHQSINDFEKAGIQRKIVDKDYYEISSSDKCVDKWLMGEDYSFTLRGSILTIKIKAKYSYLAVFESIGYSKVQDSYLLRAHLQMDNPKIPQWIKKTDELFFEEDGTITLQDEYDNTLGTLHFDSLTFKPELKTLKKAYQVVRVEFTPNGRTYDYLYEGETVPSTLQVMVKGVAKAVHVLSHEWLYEDQLALPLEKMGIATDLKKE